MSGVFGCHRPIDEQYSIKSINHNMKRLIGAICAGLIWVAIVPILIGIVIACALITPVLMTIILWVLVHLVLICLNHPIPAILVTSFGTGFVYDVVSTGKSKPL